MQKEMIRISYHLNFVLLFLDIERGDSIQLQPYMRTSLSDEAIAVATARNDNTKAAADIENVTSHAVTEMLHHPKAGRFADVVKLHARWRATVAAMILRRLCTWNGSTKPDEPAL
jgi:hypothetical protein